MGKAYYTYKCYFCKETISKEEMEEAVPIKNRFAHRICFNAWTKEVADGKKIAQAERASQKRKAIKKPIVVRETKKPESESIVKSKKEFLNVVRELTGRKPRVEESAYANHLIKEYNISYEDISKALRYFYEALGNTIKEDSNLLGIVPYVIGKSKEYYEQIDEAIKANRDVDYSTLYQERKIKIRVEREEGKLEKPIGLSNIWSKE